MPTGTWWDLSDGIVSTDKVKKKKGNRMKKYIVKKKNGIMGRLLTALLLVILLGTVLLCGGCKTAVQPKTSEATNVQTDSGEKVSLSVWAFFDENTPGTYYVDLWEELAEEYGYDIELKTYSTEQIKDKLKIALVCDELPDVFAVWGGNYPNFLFDANACLPVEKYLEASETKFADNYVLRMDTIISSRVWWRHMPLPTVTRISCRRWDLRCHIHGKNWWHWCSRAIFIMKHMGQNMQL